MLGVFHLLSVALAAPGFERHSAPKALHPDSFSESANLTARPFDKNCESNKSSLGLTIHSTDGFQSWYADHLAKEASGHDCYASIYYGVKSGCSVESDMSPHERMLGEEHCQMDGRMADKVLELTLQWFSFCSAHTVRSAGVEPERTVGVSVAGPRHAGHWSRQLRRVSCRQIGHDQQAAS